MTGIPDGSDSQSEDSLRTDLLIALVGCLSVVAFLAGGVSLIVHHAIKGPTAPYQVEFSSAGGACDEDSDSDVKGFVLDEGTGEILYCRAVAGLGGGDPLGAGGQFTGDETARVVKLAKSLAAEDGLSDEDQQAVKGLAEEIGRKHGYEPPSLAERLTGTVGVYGLAGGLVLFIGLGVWLHYTGRA
ncbi:hypothetical protein [Streptomyces flaveus]|uniref:hypothetical protein n=1 Tax=Streptomyces flaveus TaxID=66370 RepID=UPI00333145B8